MPSARRTDSCVLVAALALLVAAACGGDPPSTETSEPKPVKPPAPVEQPPKAEPPITPPAIDARVFVDVSTTMRGFSAAALKKTPLRVVHRVIDVASAEAGGGEPERCALGSMVVCTKDDDGGIKCRSTPPITCYPKKPPDWSSSSLYTARSSKLEAVLVPQPDPPRIDPDKPPPRDPVDEAGLTVLLTSSFVPDAVAGGGTSAAAACEGGASPQCITAALTERANAGYGIWLVVISLDYDGAYLADVPVDKRYLDEARAHLVDVKSVQPGEHTRFAGVDLRVSSQSALSGSDGAMSSFKYRGVRPLLMFALSRNVEQGRRFVASLTQRLREDVTLPPGKMRIDDVVQAVELAPLPSARYEALAPQLAAEQGTLDPAALTEFRVSAANIDPEGATIDVRCGAKGKGWIVAPYRAIRAAGVLPAPLAQSALLRGPLLDRGAPPAQLGVFEPMPDQGAFRIFTSCAPLAARTQPWAIEYGLRSQLAIDDGAISGAFWHQLSSPNSYQMPERIYGLSPIVQALLKLATERDTAMGRIKINVTRSE